MSREFLESLFNLDAQREILDVLRFGRRTNFVQREVASYMDPVVLEVDIIPL